MEFIKTFDIAGHRTGRIPGFGSLAIRNGKIIININDNTVHIKQIGRTKDGIGVVVEKDDIKRKTKRIMSTFEYEEDYIPIEFQGEGYTFIIPASKLSDTEYEFKFRNARMTNKK